MIKQPDLSRMFVPRFARDDRVRVTLDYWYDDGRGVPRGTYDAVVCNPADGGLLLLIESIDEYVCVGLDDPGVTIEKIWTGEEIAERLRDALQLLDTDGKIDIDTIVEKLATNIDEAFPNGGTLSFCEGT